MAQIVVSVVVVLVQHTLQYTVTIWGSNDKNEKNFQQNHTFGLFFRWPHRLATSSGSINLNSQPSPVQQMNDLQSSVVKSSNKNCHSWMGPEPKMKNISLAFKSVSSLLQLINAYQYKHKYKYCTSMSINISLPV